MFKKAHLIILTSSFLLSFLIILALNQIVKSNFKIAETSKRKLLNTTVRELFETNLPFHAEELKSDGNNIFILNNETSIIYVFDEKGNKLNYAINKSDSVTRTQHIINFFPHNGVVDIADTRKKAITSFNSQNKRLKETRLPEKVSRVLFLPNNKIVVEKLITWKKNAHFSGFVLLSSKNIEREIADFIPVTDYNGMIYDGFFVSNGDNSFFINYFFNNIVAVDSSGNIKFKSKTIDKVPLPGIKISDLGWSTYNGEVKLVNFSATIDSFYLYILTNTQQKISAGSVGYYVDKYNLKNGTYIGSFLLPQQDSDAPGKICMVNNKLFVLYKNKFIGYSL